MGKKAPKAPDPVASAQAQAQANRINQVTPSGNLTYGRVDENGNFVADTSRDASQLTLSPEREQLIKSLISQPYFSTAQLQTQIPIARDVNQNIGSTGRTTDQIEAMLPQGADIGSILGRLPTVNNDFSGEAQKARDATYQLGLSKLQPQFDLDRRRLDSNLAARGLPVGSATSGGEAYAGAMDRLDRSQGDQLNNLTLASILAGNDQASRLYDQSLRGRESEFGIQSGVAGMQENQRASRYGEQLGLANLAEEQRKNRLNENLAQLSAVLQKQGFLSNLENQRTSLGLQAEGIPLINPAGVDVQGPINQQYQAQLQQYQNGANNLLGLGNIASNLITPFKLF